MSNWYATAENPAPSAYLQYVDTSGATNLLTFDLVKSEEWEEGATITEHPVEVGADVSDHVRVKLPKVTLKIFSTNEPIAKSNSAQGNPDQPTNGPLAINVPSVSWTASTATVSYPTWENQITARILATTAAGAIGSAVGGTTGGAIGALGGGLLASLAFAGQTVTVSQGTDAGLQPPVVPTFVAQVDQWPNVTDYVAAMHALLVQLKNSAQKFTVVGTKQSEQNMVIEELAFSRSSDTGSGEEATITLKQVRVVLTDVVAAPIPNLPAGGGKPPANHGNQSTTPATSESFLHLGATGIAQAGQDLLAGKLPFGL